MGELRSIDVQLSVQGCSPCLSLSVRRSLDIYRSCHSLVRQGVSTPAACRALLGAGCIVVRKTGFLAPGSLRLGRQLEKEADVCSAV